MPTQTSPEKAHNILDLPKDEAAKVLSLLLSELVELRKENETLKEHRNTLMEQLQSIECAREDIACNVMDMDAHLEKIQQEAAAAMEIVQNADQ